MVSVAWLREFMESFSLPALAVLALIMLWRKQHREFPLMFSYIVVNVLVGITGRAVASVASQLTYFYFYWIADAVVGIFEFLVIYELFVHRLFGIDEAQQLCFHPQKPRVESGVGRRSPGGVAVEDQLQRMDSFAR